MEIERSKIEIKWEDMVKYGYVVLKNYPKTERFILGHDTRQAMWNIGKYIQLAVSIRNQRKKVYYMELADHEVARCKSLVQAGHAMQFMSTKQLGIWGDLLVQLGKMIGGWLKSVAA